jgi:hypothetical protein
MTRIASLTLAAWLAGCSAEVAQPPEDAGDSGPSTSAEAGDAASAEAGCPGTLMSCTAGCVDPQTDPKNCGACAQPCSGTQACVGGACVQPCNGAGQATCAGSCVDEDSDPTNCGSCGHACSGGQVCAGGACGPDPCAAFLDCEECVPNSACGWCLTTNSCEGASRAGTCDFWSYGTC